MWSCTIFAFFHIIYETKAELLGISPLYLTVSPLFREPIQGSILIDRELQINWIPGLFDSIAIYTSNPYTNLTEPIFKENTGDDNGHVQTNVTLGSPVFPNGWAMGSLEAATPGDHCLPFWAVGFKNNEIIHVDCLKIHPTWMQENRLAIGNLPITSLFLPGTHNSGCYKRGESLSIRDASRRYILTQDQSIWNQLVYGIRYLDFRIGYYQFKGNNSNVNLDNSFWINHDLIKVRLLPPVIQELKSFLMKTKYEVVVLDLHRFPMGFHKKAHRHQQFIEYLERELKEFAIPYTKSNPNLETIWKNDKRLIISYGENEIQKNIDWLWPPMRQLWGNKQSVAGLYDYLKGVMKNDSVKEPNKGMWAVMAQLTPNPLDLLLNPKGSLRHMAHEVNINLTNWCRNEWWPLANIVASDYFLETDLINIAIAANIQKGSIPHEYITS